jgi:HSP20 family protein
MEENQEFMPACDVEESDQGYLMSFDLPGVKKEDVKIELQENQVTVSGERKQEKKVESKGRVSQERYYGSFCRSFTLPSSVEPSKVEASYDNGVLHIAIPKIHVSASKQIPIKEGKLIEGKSGKAA